jgi:pimeloyl-ACP methyl ester carboxylesterase
MPEALASGARLNFEDGGEGPPIVLVPGLGMAEAVWADARRRLEPRFRVITVDPRGSGQSEKPPGPYTGELVAADLAAVLDAAEVKRAHVVGMSMGGMIAQELALARPERIASLILVSTYAAPDAWATRVLAARRQLIEDVGFAEQFKLAVHFVFSPQAFRTIPEFIEGLEQRIADNPPDRQAYLSQLDFCLAHDAGGRLGELSAPTLVVTGSDDFLTSRIQGAELAELIPGAQYREIPETSHGMVWEEPALFAELVADFVFANAA